ncbi:MAG: HAMP domain-containing histidine kinase [Defluviitaleaceae bacterium]|nr:HAMP domain-containing histidine kinase [Defluviitaleaceae bacterium]MCL2273837.1 HAMP domain-containing histidine kinase [Defluviitaleaceae bacterium]
MKNKTLLYLVLPSSAAFVLLTIFAALYVSRLLAQYEIETGNVLLFLSIGAGMLLFIIKAAALSLRVTKPLDKMKTAARGIKDGDYTAQTGVKQADEIGELAEILDDMARQLGNRRDFMADISHELRTPITVMRGSLEALCDGVVTDPALVADYHKKMHAESLYLERLITDLFDLARLQSTEFAITMEDVNLHEVITDAVRLISPFAEAKGVQLPCPTHNEKINIPPIMGDYGRLKQLFVALLDNAVKFTPAGKNVKIYLNEIENRINVSIIDEGNGITETDLPHIFERFYRNTSAENPTGTGLGLPIAKEIANRHGATLQIKSAPNEGTLVEVIF